MHCIPHSPSITGTSPSDYLVSYPGHSFGGGLLQSVHSTTPADCVSGEYEGLISSNHKKMSWENFFPGKPKWVAHPDWSGPGSNGNERIFHIPPNSKTGASPSGAV